MESHTIYLYGISFVFGLSLFIYKYEYSPGNNFKDYLLVLGYSAIGIVVFVIIDYVFLDYSINDILLGNMLLMHTTPYIGIYTFIISILLSIISDIFYAVFQPLISKVVINKKFRTPKIKR